MENPTRGPGKTAVVATPPLARNWPFVFVMAAGIGGLIFILVRLGALTGDAPMGGGERLSLLAPFVAISVAIERFWEIVFDTLERFLLTVTGLTGSIGFGMKWMREELANAQVAVEQAVGALAKMQTADSQASGYADLEAAEARWQAARDRITDTIKSPEYVAVKRAVTLLGSFILGLGIALAFRLALLNAAGIRMPLAADVLLTGLLIGAGPSPMHAFIGALQELRDGVASLAQLAQGAAIRNALENVSRAAGGGERADRAVPTANFPAPPTPSRAAAILRAAKRILRSRP